MMARQTARRAFRWVLGAGVAVFGANLLLAPLAEAAPPAAKLKHRGSQEDQAACTPDVFRLCFSEIPNEPRIVACLVRKKQDLSPACRVVFSDPPKSIAKSGKGSKGGKGAKGGKSRKVAAAR